MKGGDILQTFPWRAEKIYEEPQSGESDTDRDRNHKIRNYYYYNTLAYLINGTEGEHKVASQISRSAEWSLSLYADI